MNIIILKLQCQKLSSHSIRSKTTNADPDEYCSELRKSIPRNKR